MLSKKEFIKEEKEYAKMLGMSLSEYEDLNNNSKIPKFNSKNKYDDNILKQLGLTSKDLKRKSII